MCYEVDRETAEEALLQDMMLPSNAVFNKVVYAKNVENADTGTIIRTLVSEYAKERGLTVTWPEI